VRPRCWANEAGTVHVVASTRDAADLLVADVIHRRFSALPATATLGEVRAWFEESDHRRMAFLAGDGRYRGSLMREGVTGEIDPDRSAAEIARMGPTVSPDMPAGEAREIALRTDARRVAVVDADGQLLGVVAVKEDLTSFCGSDHHSQ